MAKPNLRSSQSSLELDKLSIVEEVKACMFDSKTIQEFAKAISPLLIPSVNKAVEDAFDNKIGELTERVTQLKLNNDGLSANVISLQASLDLCNQRQLVLEKKINSLEAYTRRDNLIIHGLPYASFAEAASVPMDAASITTPLKNDVSILNSVLELFNVGLGITVNPYDISTAHRLAGNRTASQPGQQTPPVIVRFVSRAVRDRVFAARIRLKSYNTGSRGRVFINEHLTEESLSLFKKALELRKNKVVFSVWSANGVVCLKTGADRNATVKRIFTENDLPSHAGSV